MCKVSISLTDQLRLYGILVSAILYHGVHALVLISEAIIRLGVDSVFEKWMDHVSVLNLYSPRITKFKINRFKSYAVNMIKGCYILNFATKLAHDKLLTILKVSQLQLLSQKQGCHTNLAAEFQII